MKFQDLNIATTKRMQRIKSKKTKLEKAFTRVLRKNKVRYESQPNLFGHPDFKLKGKKVLIFCDSSFWHGRRKREISGEAFNKNRNFWVSKLVYNKSRDKRINQELRKKGWQVLRFWDEDILKHPEKVIDNISKYV